MNEAAPESLRFELVPWQQSVWESVQRARRGDRLHHALLITGLPGMGKVRLAENIANSLFCIAPDPAGVPCGQCRPCHLFSVGNHPDLHRLGPDPESKSLEIKVDRVRELVAVEGLSSQSGGYKVIIIEPVEQMNISAANSLLKTLEEPAPKTLMLLITAYPGRLLPTVRSRCQQLHLPPPAEAEALEWLKAREPSADPLLALRLANGAPLAALDLMDSDLLQQRSTAFDAFLLIGQGRADPLATAESWLKIELPLLFEWLSSWVADLARLQSGHQAPRLGNPDRHDELAALAARVQPEALHRFWSRMMEARGQLQSNLNPQLMLESLLVQWSELGVR